MEVKPKEVSARCLSSRADARCRPACTDNSLNHGWLESQRPLYQRDDLLRILRLSGPPVELRDLGGGRALLLRRPRHLADGGWREEKRGRKHERGADMAGQPFNNQSDHEGTVMQDDQHEARVLVGSMASCSGAPACARAIVSRQVLCRSKTIDPHPIGATCLPFRTIAPLRQQRQGETVRARWRQSRASGWSHPGRVMR